MKKIIKFFVSKFKYIVLKYVKYQTIYHFTSSLYDSATMLFFLKRGKIDFVVDIGANEGQFAIELRKLGYKGKILSFEPLSSVHATLTEKAKFDKNWVIADKIAIGATNTKININVSGNSVSSSILEIMPNHVLAEPTSSYTTSEEVIMRRLDDIIFHHINDEIQKQNTLLLKVDVQGYEYEVLKGAKECLKLFKYVLLETSLVSLYDKQETLENIIFFMRAEKFEPISILPGFNDPKTNQMLQCDIIFKNTQNL